ncbi:MAG: TetR/AcrR family transcriptional regulator [Lachnospiraceae bacterium]
MQDSEKELKKRQNTALFINTTQNLMEQSEELSQISIRKIADKAGFHNSTIYLYFKDLDELLMLSSMKYFYSYSEALEALSKKNSHPTDTFIAVWELFCETIFEKPNIFYNFFFGKRSENLQAIIKKYYQIFPEELNSFTREIETMYFGNNITDRSLIILQPMINEDNAVTAENIDLINDIIISFCKYRLEQKCKNKKLDNKTLISEIRTMILYVCGIK